MQLFTESYLEQKTRWPPSGRHILAQYDDEHVVVYQAYVTETGRFAADHGYFGIGFSLSRMTWIKPNFLWMMFRSGWGTKPGQEVTLAIWLKRTAFEQILSQAVPSTYHTSDYADDAAWKDALKRSDVRLQWDPDHGPSGNKVERRAIQLGLRGETVRNFAQGGWISHIEDISEFVAQQRENAKKPYTDLMLPREDVYPVTDESIARQIRL